jgi:ketosteroid isomerase-like protein
MKYSWILILCALVGFSLPARGQQKSAHITVNPALEKELFAVELQWMKGEFDKNMDLLNELWTDDFLDVLSSGRVVNKHEMMDQMAKADRKPGTGAFPENFKLRAVYGNVALATDHTIIKGVDANGNIVVAREMNVLRMFVKEKGKWRVAGAGLVPIAAR